jgi:hypothetical protein
MYMKRKLFHDLNFSVIRKKFVINNFKGGIFMLNNTDASSSKIRVKKALPPLERNRKKIRDWRIRIRKFAKELGYKTSSNATQMEVYLDYTHAKSFKFISQNNLGSLTMRDWVHHKLPTGKISSGDWSPYCFLTIKDEESLLDAMNILKACINSRAGK